MAYHVPTLSIVFMAVAALAGIAIPLALFLVLRRRYGADIKPFFVGSLVFIVFALVLEGAINYGILHSAAGTAIMGNRWLYGLFGGLMAGLFEETGRFAAFQTLLRKQRGNDHNALMYGAGHGGFEALYILILGMASNLSVALLVNSGNIEPLTANATTDAARQALEASLATLAGASPALFLMSIVERLAAVTLHLSLSTLVWFAAKKGGRQLWLYPLAILLHTLVNAVAVIMAGYVSNVWFVMAAIYLMCGACAVLAVTVYRRHTAQQPNLPAVEAAVQ